VRRSTAATAAVAVALVALAGPAFAHDPGQGDEVAPVTLVASRAGDRIDLVLRGDGTCVDWTPREVVARRAGRTHTAALVATGECRYAGSVTVDDPGRWFVYAELEVDGRVTEAWLPVEHGQQSKETELYVPAVRSSWTPQVVSGAVLYALVIAVFVAVAATYRRAALSLEPIRDGRPRGARHEVPAATSPRNVKR
jgi:hypothetical protein